MPFDNFCVVVPMFNEARGACDCVRAITARLRTLGDKPVLIAVNDGSTDDTLSILQACEQDEPRLRVVDCNSNQGYGAALRAGAREGARLGYEYAVFMDSDLTNDPADLSKFAECMVQGCDVVKASRFVPGGGMQGVPKRRARLSTLGNAAARLLFRIGIRDVTNGFRAIRISLLLKMPLHERGFASIVEELYHCKVLGASFCEVPVVLTNRSAHLRPTSFAYKPSTLYRYLKYCLLAFGVNR